MSPVTPSVGSSVREPRVQKKPARQRPVGADKPVPLQWRRSGQGKHAPSDVPPADGLYVPLAHASGACEPAGQKWPDGQGPPSVDPGAGSASAEPDVQKNPAAQSPVSSVSAELTQCLPGEQAKQADALRPLVNGLNVPDGHGVGTVEFSGQ